MNNALIIFVDNTEEEKLTSEIEKVLGNETALAVHRYLLKYTSEICASLNLHRFVFYSSYVHLNDAFDDNCFTKFVQEGNSSAEKMQHAFEKVLAMHHQKVCFIRANCYEITASHLEQAFASLENNSIVIGATENGGYYLFGVDLVFATLLKSKDWFSSATVIELEEKIRSMHLSLHHLEELRTIESASDLQQTNILEELADGEE